MVSRSSQEVATNCGPDDEVGNSRLSDPPMDFIDDGIFCRRGRSSDTTTAQSNCLSIPSSKAPLSHHITQSSNNGRWITATLHAGPYALILWLRRVRFLISSFLSMAGDLKKMDSDHSQEDAENHTQLAINICSRNFLPQRIHKRTTRDEILPKNKRRAPHPSGYVNPSLPKGEQQSTCKRRTLRPSRRHEKKNKL